MPFIAVATMTLQHQTCRSKGLEAHQVEHRRCRATCHIRIFAPAVSHVRRRWCRCRRRGCCLPRPRPHCETPSQAWIRYVSTILSISSGVYVMSCTSTDIHAKIDMHLLLRRMPSCSRATYRPYRRMFMGVVEGVGCFINSLLLDQILHAFHPRIDFIDYDCRDNNEYRKSINHQQANSQITYLHVKCWASS